MNVSYLVTCSTETGTLKRLLEKVFSHLGNDELVILQDESLWNNDRRKYLADITELNKVPSKIVNLPIFVHPLNRDYGTHKNFGIEKCKGDWIFQIDGDELPPESLIGENLHELIESNSNVEAYAVPRINAWLGLTPEHAKQWGWGLDESATYKRLRAAWPDYQWRIFKNTPSIRFRKRLHERIDGFKAYAILPAEEEWALYHDKTIETQITTNLRYNEWFTSAENEGVSKPIS